MAIGRQQSTPAMSEVNLLNSWVALLLKVKPVFQQLQLDRRAASLPRHPRIGDAALWFTQKVQGNFIGTNIAGMKAIPNYNGIMIQGGALNQIGLNVIS